MRSAVMSPIRARLEVRGFAAALRSAALPCGALLAALLAAAASAQPASVQPASVQPASAQPPNTILIDVENFMFAPLSMTVKAGATVTWTNRDQEPHTVMSSDGSFRSGALD